MPARPVCVVLQSFGGSPSIHIDSDRNLNIYYMAAMLALFIFLNNRHYGPIAYKYRIIFFANSDDMRSSHRACPVGCAGTVGYGDGMGCMGCFAVTAA